MSRKQWRCFFCDEVFTRAKDAAEHFGCDEGCEADVPACKLAAHEGHLIKYIRSLEKELRSRMHEDHDLHKAVYTLEAEKAREVREAEERGYNKAVQDMTAQGYCADPHAHNPDAKREAA